MKFSHLSRNMTMQRTMKLYRLPEASGAWVVAGVGLGGQARGLGEPLVTRFLGLTVYKGYFCFIFLVFPNLCLAWHPC